MKKFIQALLVFCLVMFVFSLFQGLGTAVIHAHDKDFTVYDFGNYSFFNWILQILYWGISISLSFLIAVNAD